MILSYAITRIKSFQRCNCWFIFSLQLGELLGEGAFGKVYKGFALGIDGRMEPTVVAVKMLKGMLFCLFLH